MITLQIKRLHKSFGSKMILRDLSLEYSGDPLGISGANGSGKSTLLKCMGGLLSPTRGNIVWTDESEPLTKEQLRHRLGYAAPYINLYDELSCLENLHFLSAVRNPQDKASQPVEEWIRKTGLRAVSDQPYGNLSTGQQQRLRLAAALFHQPDILLLDEPGSNLDEAGKSLIIDISQRFQDNPSKLLIIASNNPEELDLCGRIFSVEEHTFT
ncbi:heme exporter protein A [Fodinibius roseus]|uniref:Heme exporter protein A n=1 Tax=Fodinibius roseus TaxID=1194090 RepID=A0A1M5H4E3_9BACT|nr:ABC transporter ATP-binding protein [Fodinibius roseus]SHG10879.1 heme exporter protein A [Fodinibius roseus]